MITTILLALAVTTAPAPAAAPPSHPWTLVKTDGTKVLVRAKPVSMFGTVTTVALDGATLRLPAGDVDMVATAKANESRPKTAPLTIAELPALTTVDGAPATPTAPGPAASPGGGQNEAQWRATANARRAAAASAQAAHAASLREIARVSVLAASSPEGAYLQSKAREAAARTRADLEAAQASLSSLEDEARVAGALPGWIR